MKFRYLIILSITVLLLPAASASNVEIIDIEEGQSQVLEVGLNTEHTFEVISIDGEENDHSIRVNGELSKVQNGDTVDFVNGQIEVLYVHQDFNGNKFMTISASSNNTLCENCDTPIDPDNDGLFEDVNGDGELDDQDTEILFNNTENAPEEWFDFNEDGEVNVGDPQSLQNEIDSWGENFLTNSKDHDGDGLYEDVNGDGEVNRADVSLLFNLQSKGADLETDRYDFNDDGSLNSVDVTRLSVMLRPNRICENCERPKDLDEDGKFEDINGDGELTEEDVQRFSDIDFSNRYLRTSKFDFNSDGQLTIDDGNKLVSKMSKENVCRMNTEENSVRSYDFDGDLTIGTGDLQKTVDEWRDDKLTDYSLNVITAYWQKSCKLKAPKLCDNCNRADDLDGDGKFEDVDGNGEIGYNDVDVLYSDFTSLPNSYFDYNGNDVVGFRDIQWLREEVRYRNDNDLSDLEEMYFASNARLISPSDRMENVEEQTIENISKTMDLGVIKDTSGNISQTKKNSNLLVVGNQSINAITDELVRNGDVESISSDSENTGRITLVEDAYARGMDVVVISGHSSEDLDKAANYFLEAYSGDRREELEGKKTKDLDFSSKKARIEEDSLDLPAEIVSAKPYTAELVVSNPGENRFEGQINLDFEAREVKRAGFAKTKNIEVLPGEDKTIEINFTADSPMGGKFQPGIVYDVKAGLYESIEPDQYGNPGYKLIEESDSVSTEIVEAPDPSVSIENWKVMKNSEEISVEFSILNNVEKAFSYSYNLRLDDRDENISTGETGELAQGESADFVHKQDLDNLTEGRHGVYLRVRRDGEVLGTQSQRFTVEKNQKKLAEIELSEGWNLISAPEQVNAVRLADISDDCNLESFDGEISWVYSDGEWSHPETVHGTQGVWVKSGPECTASITEVPEASSTDKLEEGWNMISVQTETSLQQISGTCEFDEYLGTTVWGHEDGEWQENTVTDELHTDQGYYVKTSSACSLGEESQISKPTGSFMSALGGLVK